MNNEKIDFSEEEFDRLLHQAFLKIERNSLAKQFEQAKIDAQKDDFDLEIEQAFLAKERVEMKARFLELKREKGNPSWDKYKKIIILLGLVALLSLLLFYFLAGKKDFPQTPKTEIRITDTANKNADTSITISKIPNVGVGIKEQVTNLRTNLPGLELLPISGESIDQQVNNDTLKRTVNIKNKIIATRIDTLFIHETKFLEAGLGFAEVKAKTVKMFQLNEVGKNVNATGYIYDDEQIFYKGVINKKPRIFKMPDGTTYQLVNETFYNLQKSTSYKTLDKVDEAGILRQLNKINALAD